MLQSSLDCCEGLSCIILHSEPVCCFSLIFLFFPRPPLAEKNLPCNILHPQPVCYPGSWLHNFLFCCVSILPHFVGILPQFVSILPQFVARLPKYCCTLPQFVSEGFGQWPCLIRFLASCRLVESARTLFFGVLCRKAG